MNVLASNQAAGGAPRAAPAPADKAEWLLATLTLAFASDPPCRWMYPDPAQYLRHFPDFARALGGAALAHGTALVSEAGAALWLPPGAEPDEEALSALVARSVREHERDGVLALFSAMAGFHPKEPHWYLPLIGVEPARQGRGHGVALMAPVLARCDGAGLPAYLEATSLRSRPLYERLGFEAIGRIEVAGCPPITPMLRRPRRR